MKASFLFNILGTIADNLRALIYGGPQLSRQNKIQNNKLKLLPAN